MKFPLADDHSELDLLIEESFAALDDENIETIYKSLDFFRARLARHIILRKPKFINGSICF
ncbi:MAG: hypothetical protein C4342_01360 [Armatimonadota bacterium]